MQLFQVQGVADDSGLFSQLPPRGRVQRLAVADESAGQGRFAAMGHVAAFDQQDVESPIPNGEDHQIHGHGHGGGRAAPTHCLAHCHTSIKGPVDSN
ncbi:hypothetical protein GCM10010486_52900 [Nonomuraea roseoviolacea subsp. carminata]